MTDKQTYQREFSALPSNERRTIIRAVNRGLAVDTRRHAPLAVAVARRQIRFWRLAWLLGPALGLVQLTFSPPDVALSNGLFGTLVLAAFAWFWIRRARRSEEANLSIARGRVGPPSRSAGAGTDTDSSSGGQEQLRPRPPAPRGKKRRRR